MQKGKDRAIGQGRFYSGVLYGPRGARRGASNEGNEIDPEAGGEDIDYRAEIPCDEREVRRSDGNDPP